VVAVLKDAKLLHRPKIFPEVFLDAWIFAADPGLLSGADAQ
jgi:hypothetical protein